MIQGQKEKRKIGRQGARRFQRRRRRRKAEQKQVKAEIAHSRAKRVEKIFQETKPNAGKARQVEKERKSSVEIASA